MKNRPWKRKATFLASLAAACLSIFLSAKQTNSQATTPCSNPKATPHVYYDESGSWICWCRTGHHPDPTTDQQCGQSNSPAIEPTPSPTRPPIQPTATPTPTPEKRQDQPIPTATDTARTPTPTAARATPTASKQTPTPHPTQPPAPATPTASKQTPTPHPTQPPAPATPTATPANTAMPSDLASSGRDCLPTHRARPLALCPTGSDSGWWIIWFDGDRRQTGPHVPYPAPWLNGRAQSARNPFTGAGVTFYWHRSHLEIDTVDRHGKPYRVHINTHGDESYESW